MKRRWRILLMVGGCGVVAAVALVLSRDREPRYKGRTLTEWLLVYSPPGLHPPWSVVTSHEMAERREAAEAVRHIGTNALPWPIKWVRYRGDQTAINKMRRTAAAKLPRAVKDSSLFHWLLIDRAGLHADAAVAGFEILSAQASLAVPDLARLMEDPRVPPRTYRVMDCLAAIGTNGLPPLLAAVTNRARPSLARGLAARHVAHVAGQIKTSPNPAVPALVQCVEDGDRRLVLVGVVALGELATEPGVTVPVLTNALGDSNAPVRYEAARGLGRFGRRSVAGVPGLVNALNDPEFAVRRAATNALREIDPEALEKKDGAGGRGN